MNNETSRENYARRLTEGFNISQANADNPTDYDESKCTYNWTEREKGQHRLHGDDQEPTQ